MKALIRAIALCREMGNSAAIYGMSESAGFSSVLPRPGLGDQRPKGWW
jgi:hypothetical protein